MQKLPVTLAFAGLVLLGAARPATGQTVRGRVAETTSGTAVGNGFVVLVGMDGKEVTRTLTDRMGRFTIKAPAPGRYRLRSERIGFRLTVSDPIQLKANETIDQELGVAPVAIRLDEVRIVAGENVCRVRPQDGQATATVWEEARKALAAVAWSQRQSLLKVTLSSFAREVEPDLRVKAESTVSRTGYTNRPFKAQPAAQLASEGYVQATPDSAFMFYAPDAEVLFSDEFLNTHCLRLESGGVKHAGRIGLAFEPSRNQKAISDIRGVMWLDEQSAELESVEFQYVNTRLPGESDLMGGRVDFQQLVNGVWVVDHWYIRMPMFGMIAGAAREVRFGRGMTVTAADGAPRVEVVAFREEGGGLVDVFDRDGNRLATTAGATLSGSIFDSTLAAPMVGATVRLVGPGLTTRSGPAGQFRMDRLADGKYELEFWHDDHPSWGVMRPGVTVDLERGHVTETRLSIPPAARLYATLCPTFPADSAFGAAGGIVTGAGDAPMADVGVQVTWMQFHLAGSDAIAGGTTGVGTETEENGYFRVCGLPAGSLLTAQTMVGKRPGPPVEFRVGKGELKDLKLVVPKP